MAIIKSKQAGNFTVLPNEVFKSKLSLDAIGLLAYLLSLPADWIIYKTTLHNQLDMGREKVNNAFNKLRTAGYIVSEKMLDEENKRISYKHYVYDKPQTGFSSTESVKTDKPQTGFSSTDNPLVYNIDNKETLTKEILTNEDDFSFDDYVFLLNSILQRKYKGCSKSKGQFTARIKEGRKMEDFKLAILNAMKQENHITSNYMYLTPEFFSRADKLDYFINISFVPVIKVHANTAPVERPSLRLD